jgi:putative ABC transport system ATP-binding protein
MTALTAALELSGVEYSYRRNAALRGVTLQVKSGEVVAITGASGGGKSTLLHCAAGILTPDAGTVRVAGQDLAALPEDQRARLRRTKVGIVLQFGQLVPDLPLVDNVALPLLLDTKPRSNGSSRSGSQTRPTPYQLSSPAVRPSGQPSHVL